MPFGGGGGAGTTLAHKHTNNFADGGTLDDTTLINNDGLSDTIEDVSQKNAIALGGQE